MAAPAPPAAPAPTPALRLDAALGLVVLELRDAAGTEVRTIPSERELRAYRRAAHGAGAEAATRGPDPVRPLPAPPAS